MAVMLVVYWRCSIRRGGARRWYRGGVHEEYSGGGNVGSDDGGVAFRLYSFPPQLQSRQRRERVTAAEERNVDGGKERRRRNEGTGMEGRNGIGGKERDRREGTTEEKNVE